MIKPFQNGQPGTGNRHFINIAIFASGAGTNAQKIIDHFTPSPFPVHGVKKRVRVALIVCNNPKAGVLQIAEKEKIPILIIEKKPV